MTYQVLARKWRPRTFKEMTGQGHVLKTLIKALDSNRLHHAYLFTGTRGVGKTTIARILARCLNCEQGVSSEPCGTCSACTEITEGRFVDLIEVDAASRTKVDQTRELLDNVQYAPTRGRYKIYLIDEVHMLSDHSFNALLKTLEEPPPHVKFLLATTDPQKLPVTVLSRCLQFNLKNLSPELTMQHLKYILEQEGIDAEEAALWQLGRAAKGSMRDGLTLLDQAISFCRDGITEHEVSAFLGTIDQSILYQLVDALVEGDAAALLKTVEEAAEQAPDFGAILEALLTYLHRVAIAQVLPQGIDNSQGDKAKVLEHAKAMPAENVQLYYQIALKGREDLPLAVDDRSGMEMTLLRMLAFTPAGTAATLVSEKKKPLITESTPMVESEPPAPVVPEASTALVTRELAVAAEMPEAILESAAAQPANASGEDLKLSALTPADWIPLFYKLELEGILRSIAANCSLASVNGSKIELKLDESQAAIYSENHRVRIQEALSRFFHDAIDLSIVTEKLATETPALYRERKMEERRRKAIDTFLDDKHVKAVLERFNGNIIMDSIKPLTPEDY